MNANAAIDRTAHSSKGIAGPITIQSNRHGSLAVDLKNAVEGLEGDLLTLLSSAPEAQKDPPRAILGCELADNMDRDNSTIEYALQRIASIRSRLQL